MVFIIQDSLFFISKESQIHDKIHQNYTIQTRKLLWLHSPRKVEVPHPPQEAKAPLMGAFACNEMRRDEELVISFWRAG